MRQCLKSPLEELAGLREEEDELRRTAKEVLLGAENVDAEEKSI